MGDGRTAQDSPRQAGDPAPPRPRVTAHALTQVRYDHELQALVRTVYGYSWTCTVHGRGPTFGAMREAQAGKREHEAEHKRTGTGRPYGSWQGSVDHGQGYPVRRKS